MSATPSDEIRRLRDENAKLRIHNQRLEFEKAQQAQRLESAEAARKLLEDQIQTLFQQIDIGCRPSPDYDTDICKESPGPSHTVITKEASPVRAGSYHEETQFYRVDRQRVTNKLYVYPDA